MRGRRVQRSKRGARGGRRCPRGRDQAAGGWGSGAATDGGGQWGPDRGLGRRGEGGGGARRLPGPDAAPYPARSRNRAAAGPGWGTMGTSASKGRAAPVPAPKPQPEEGLDLSRLPPELLLAVLSYVPPRELLRRCRLVCRGWRALVDGQALWLLILARDRSAAGRALLSLVRSCLPPAGDARPCLLGRFCERRPIGRNLICNPCGQEGLRKWMVQHGGDGWVVEENRTTVPGAPSQTCFVASFRWCRKKQVLDLEKEGLWPELLDSGKIEICVSDWWGARHDSGCKYRLFVKLLDATQTVLDKFSAVPDPIEQWNNDICLQVTHVFSNITTGVRFVSFEHLGQDTQFWAGHYGTRVTNSSVIVRVSQP